VDPFCGDGTVAIEAALAYPGARVSATDIDPARLANAAANARRAGVGIDLAVADAGHLAGPAGVVLTNPPWNLAVDATGTLSGSLEPFWRALSGALGPGGRLCAVVDADLDAGTALRRLGFATGLAARIRLAGRVSEVLVAGPPGSRAPALPAGPAAWRDRASAAGVTGDGFG
jgi:tRNA (guanine6-N2)-methyltransferase